MNINGFDTYVTCQCGAKHKITIDGVTLDAGGAHITGQTVESPRMYAQYRGLKRATQELVSWIYGLATHPDIDNIERGYILETDIDDQLEDVREALHE